MAFLSDYRSNLPNTLTDKDWDILKETHRFLQPFWEATLHGQKETVSLDQTLATMDALLLWFEQQKVCHYQPLLIHTNYLRSSTLLILTCFTPSRWAGSYYLSTIAYLMLHLRMQPQSFYIL